MENKIKIRLRLVIIKQDKLLAYYDSMDDYYFYIGGKLEYGETLEEGWKREIEEELGFEAKQAIVRKVVDTIVGTQHDIKVYGHLALNSSIIANVWKGGIQDVKFETSSRDSWSAKRGEVHTF